MLKLIKGNNIEDGICDCCGCFYWNAEDDMCNATGRIYLKCNSGDNRDKIWVEDDGKEEKMAKYKMVRGVEFEDDDDTMATCKGCVFNREAEGKGCGEPQYVRETYENDCIITDPDKIWVKIEEEENGK